MRSEKKDLIAIFIIGYLGAFLFWFHCSNSIYTKLDFYIFITGFTLMLILPVFVILFKTKGLNKNA